MYRPHCLVTRDALLRSMLWGTAGGARPLTDGCKHAPIPWGEEHWEAAPGSSDLSRNLCSPAASQLHDLKEAPSPPQSPPHPISSWNSHLWCLSAREKQGSFPGWWHPSNLLRSASQPSGVTPTGQIPGLSVQTQPAPARREEALAGFQS